jgi:pimeloyl-ACP methyl ester carboxylesterase
VTNAPLRHLEHQGCRLAYRVTGTGEPVLFVQGVATQGDGWAPQTQELADAYACLSFDNRGMGASQPFRLPLSVAQMADDARALADAQGWQRLHVVGHSLGGLVAQQFALTWPQRVRSLSLLCTFARGKSAASSRRMMWIGMRTRIGTRAMRRRAFLEIVYPPAFLAVNDRDALARALEPVFGHDLADTPRVTAAQLAAMVACNVTERLGELRGVPTLVVSGRHDPIAPTPLGRRIADGIPGATFVEMADAAHGVPVHFAGETNRLLRAHFAAAR